MGKFLSDIESSARDILRDEFVEGTDLSWESDELRRLIQMTLDEVEEKMPYEARVKAFDALSTVATELSATATTLEVTSDDSFSSTFPFYVTIEDECIKVTALASSENFTVTRAQKDTTAAVHAVGKDVGLSIMTTVDSREIDITNISDLIRLRRNKPIEYRTYKNPRQFRNCEVFAKILTMDIYGRPSADETVWLHCLKKHTLTDNTSTLEPQHETILILGTCAKAARNKGREQIGSLNVGGVNVGPRMIEVGERWKLDYEKALRHSALQDYWEALPKD